MQKYLINTDHKLSFINKDIYGNFSEHLGRCIYEGLYVGENSDIENVNGMRVDVVNALKEMGLPVLRWPGGCFADEYHWKDGIGPKENRKKMINTHWGGVVEDNSFGTDEFMELCRQIGCDVYVNGNVGSGTVQEMSEWMEYMTSDSISPMANLRRENGHDKPYRVKYFCVGNESWGCGGNMTPEYYANEYRRYNTFVRTYDRDNHAFRIACGPNAEDYNWTEKLLQGAGGHMDGLSLHYYTLPHDWNHKGSATQFDETEFYVTLSKAYKIDDVITKHINVMDRYDRNKRIKLIVDEWGTWYDVEPGTNPGFLYQQNTMRDALVAALTLNVFNKHSDRIIMCNIAQTVNVLQSIALTEGKKMVLTPTYYAFKLFKDHQNSTLLDSYLTTDVSEKSKGYKLPHLVESASVKEDGTVCSTIVNTDLEKAEDVKCVIAGKEVESVQAWIISSKMDAYNTFDEKDNVVIKEYDAFKVNKDGFTAKIPACSVVKFIVK